MIIWIVRALDFSFTLLPACWKESRARDEKEERAVYTGILKLSTRRRTRVTRIYRESLYRPRQTTALPFIASRGSCGDRGYEGLELFIRREKRKGNRARITSPSAPFLLDVAWRDVT